jgi:formate-dependent nitrite reductase cytochrome c552 subunit
MTHTITYRELPSGNTLANCECGWECEDPTFPWLVRFAKQHAAIAGKRGCGYPHSAYTVGCLSCHEANGGNID